MDYKKIIKELRADLFYQISAKHGAEKASKYPSIIEADKALQQVKILSLGGVMPSFKSSLENKVKSYKDDIKRNWENIISESEYNKLDGIEPFIRLIKLYSHKLEEVESIIDDFNKR